MEKLLITLGVALIIIGLLWERGLKRMPLFRLPGDLHWKVGETHVYVPLMTSLLLSLVLTLFFFILRLMK
ncbi:MAG: DUF2905 family protein [Candidatus Carbobacillus sp.]|nr:DUF2905 family protein [Candidatus Carbobacillus sp.]